MSHFVIQNIKKICPQRWRAKKVNTFYAYGKVKCGTGTFYCRWKVVRNSVTTKCSVLPLPWSMLSHSDFYPPLLLCHHCKCQHRGGKVFVLLEKWLWPRGLAERASDSQESILRIAVLMKSSLCVADFESFDLPEEHQIAQLPLSGVPLMILDEERKLEKLLHLGPPSPLKAPSLPWESGKWTRALLEGPQIVCVMTLAWPWG